LIKKNPQKDEKWNPACPQKQNDNSRRVGGTVAKTTGKKRKKITECINALCRRAETLKRGRGNGLLATAT